MPGQGALAGLLAADGNVLARQHRVTLELSVRDRELVELARDQLAPRCPLRERLRTNGAHTIILAITSPQLCCDLANLGVTPRKSLTLEWPQRLDAKLQRAFLLGYFDSDGFITWSKNGRYLYPRWGLLGTHAFLSGALALIVAQTRIRPRVIHLRPESRIHSFHVNGRDAWAVDEWIHAHVGLGLTRKRLTSQAPPHSRMIGS